MYEIEIDAITGKIKEFEKDDHEDKKQAASQTTVKVITDGRLSAEKAKSMALELTGRGKIIRV